MRYIPNILTWLRLLSAPVLVTVFLLAPEMWRDTLTAALFVIAALTDALDGYIARYYKVTSRFGEFLDPVADKIMVITALLLLLREQQAPLIAVVIIVCREIYILGMREWMAEIGKSKMITPSFAGKVKTAVQMTAITLLLLQRDLFGLPLVAGGEALLWAAAVLSVYSMVMYKIAFMRQIME